MHFSHNYCKATLLCRCLKQMAEWRTGKKGDWWGESCDPC